MKYKKALSGLLVAGMVFSNASAFAADEMMVKESKAIGGSQIISEESQPNLSQEEAEGIFKSHIKDFYNINIDEGKEGMHISIHFREEFHMNGATWQLNLHHNDQDKYLNIYAMIKDETKELLSIRKHEGSHRQTGQITKFTFEEAENIALKFLKKYKTDALSQLSSKAQQQPMYYYYGLDRGPGLHPREYYVFFEREEEGISFMNEGITIGVNSGTGEVVSYEYRWSNEELPAKNDVITPEAAQKSFVEALDFNLQYVPIYNKGGYYGEPIEEVKLVYSPNFADGHLVDATDGKMINPYQNQMAETKTIDVSDAEKKSFEAMTKEKVEREKEINKEEAVKIAKEVLGKFYEDFKIQSTNYYSNRGHNSQKNWQIEFTTGEDLYNRGNISINAMTEEVMDINNYNWARREMMMMNQEDFTAVLEWEDAYKEAIEIIKEIYPDRLKDVETEQRYAESYFYMNDVKMPNPEYHFSFNRKENDIAFLQNNILVSFDRTTGQLQSLNYRWDDIELPKPEGLMSKEEAVDLYLEQTDMELAYVVIPERKIEETESETVLVYRSTPKRDFMYYSIDAKNGKFLDYRGKEIKEEKQQLDSVGDLLKGHWAERELTIMHDSGIIDLQNYSLKESVPKKEIIRMIIKSIGYYMDSRDVELELKFTDISKEDPYYEEIKLAVQQGIIENEAVAFKGEDPVTREELAVMLVKMAKLDKLAKVEEIYTLPVQDVDCITPDYLGYTALAYGFDVIKGDGEKYNPKAVVTLEQVAVAIYRNFKNLLYIIR
ncbi:S-layer homology domain-containing protein [Alkaliphilus hydrothermalis]|uniref:SLH domain-containing protein n=1 Tax=Alkaliphilus hydrothermalis TaxID=1482730 RepID=A0ABS2NQ22_9FIRM|nr:S-layer homology domain-containing protein [Alkaliphilus hydrothermalis]MBM7615028.1 hypothetical protein [Alkaliphilus hydrothermalis]